MRQNGIIVGGSSIITRFASAALLASLLAGCSSDALRLQDGFYTGAPQSGTDSLTTASIPVPQADVTGAASGPRPAMPLRGNETGDPLTQQYPGDVASGQDRYALAPAPGAAQSTSVQSAPLAAPGQASYPAAQSSANLTTGTIPSAASRPQPQPQQAQAPKGWSTVGAPSVTLQQNESISSVARRYGVPADALMKANNITDARQVSAGQRLVIPSYSRGGPAPSAQSAAGAPAPTPAQAGAVNQQLAERPLNEQAAELAAALQPAAQQAASGGTYTVKSGDTLTRIASAAGMSVSALKAANGLDSDTIRVGQTLNLSGSAPVETAAAQPAPATDPQPTGTVQTAPAQEADSGPAGYTAPSETAASETEIEREVNQEVATAAPASSGVEKLRWPVQGQVVTAFGAQDGNVRNDGIDISVPEGSEIKAAENGVVIYAGSGLKEYGNTVLVRHDSGLVTVYGHAKELNVARGDSVSRGQVIARSGMTGTAERPKLHFEVRDNATPVDPAKYLQ